MMDINDRLQKADRLIRRQRITIAVMTVTLLVSGIYSWSILSLWKARVQDQEDFVSDQMSLFTGQNTQIGENGTRIWEMQKKVQHDAGTIRDLDRKLHQYEMRFGPLPRAGKPQKGKD